MLVAIHVNKNDKIENITYVLSSMPFIVPGAMKRPVPPTLGIILSGFEDVITTSTKTNNNKLVIASTPDERRYKNTTRSLLVLNHEMKRHVSKTNMEKANTQLIVVVIDIAAVLYCKVSTICSTT